jgi:hypothetical protein
VFDSSKWRGVFDSSKWRSVFESSKWINQRWIWMDLDRVLKWMTGECLVLHTVLCTYGVIQKWHRK